MPFLQIIVLSAIQGITEFLPISSWGHLILVSDLAGWPDQSLKIEVAVHVGTLGAVVIYFWRDIWDMLAGLSQMGRRGTRPAVRLAFYLMVATVPVLIAGGLVTLFARDVFRDPTVIAIATMGFAVLLYLADRYGLTIRRVEHMTLGSALFIGLAQMLAIIPGTSRAGVTMTAARIAGFERTAAARFSLLLSVPVIAAAGAVTAFELGRSGDTRLTTDALISAGFAFAIGLLAIWILLQLLKRVSFTPFVIYRLLLGTALLVWIYL